jgi:hypothetical protein
VLKTVNFILGEYDVKMDCEMVRDLDETWIEVTRSRIPAFKVVVALVGQRVNHNSSRDLTVTKSNNYSVGRLLPLAVDVTRIRSSRNCFTWNPAIPQAGYNKQLISK